MKVPDGFGGEHDIPFPWGLLLLGLVVIAGWVAFVVWAAS